jgi:hypothetical protein
MQPREEIGIYNGQLHAINTAFQNILTLPEIIRKLFIYTVTSATNLAIADNINYSESC